MNFTLLRIAVLFTIVTLIVTQVTKPAQPYTFTNALAMHYTPIFVLPRVNNEALLEEDRIEALNQKLPLRFAVPIDVNINLTNSGSWYILPNGARLWRLKIVSPGAKLTSVIFNRYNLPTGAQLFIIGDEEKQKFLGALTSENNKAHGRLATAPIEGESITLEYYEPKEVIGKGKLSIQTIMHGYRNVFPTSEPMEDLSGYCNINVKCPLGKSREIYKN